jgi:8-oxo-dGTP pyrophosphatase MutT (NUDIX family)
MHRPVGGGLEEGETPEEAVRREVMEELGVTLGEIEPLGSIDHVWQWKGRENHERAWVFLSSSDMDERLSRGETPELIEADGDRFPTVWRAVRGPAVGLPPLCPAALEEMLARRFG